jgi:hypothetical protein
MRRRLNPDQNNFTPHSDIFDSIFFASRETKFEMYKRILVAARIAPPLKVGAARPPHSSALSTLWWRMAQSACDIRGTAPLTVTRRAHRKWCLGVTQTLSLDDLYRVIEEPQCRHDERAHKDLLV